eukprot:15435487-Alexandrium_andersonii.AAC.1
MGPHLAFLEDGTVAAAVKIARTRPGAPARLRAAAREEARAGAPITVNPMQAVAELPERPPAVRQLVGPKGGLPRTKPEMEMLCKLLAVRTDGLTVGQMRQRVRPVLGTRRCC